MKGFLFFYFLRIRSISVYDRLPARQKQSVGNRSDALSSLNFDFFLIIYLSQEGIGVLGVVLGIKLVLVRFGSFWFVLVHFGSIDARSAATRTEIDREPIFLACVNF